MARPLHEARANQLTWEPGDYGESSEPYTADAASLLRYLDTEIMPWYDRERAEIVARPAVRAQALGEALDPDKLERLARYEVHLDRKLERTLSTLLRLQELRRARLLPVPTPQPSAACSAQPAPGSWPASMPSHPRSMRRGVSGPTGAARDNVPQVLPWSFGSLGG